MARITQPMLGRYREIWKLSKGRKPCNCLDCLQDTWGVSHGKAKRFHRGQLRTKEKREWKREINNPAYGE